MNKFPKRSITFILVLFINVIFGLVVEASVCEPKKNAASSLTPTDWIRAENGQLTIQGTVLLSFEDDHVVMQSGSSFLEIRKDLVRGADSVKLNQPGARVVLKIPQQAVLRAWAVNFGDSEKNESGKVTCCR